MGQCFRALDNSFFLRFSQNSCLEFMCETSSCLKVCFLSSTTFVFFGCIAQNKGSLNTSRMNATWTSRRSSSLREMTLAWTKMIIRYIDCYHKYLVIFCVYTVVHLFVCFCHFPRMLVFLAPPMSWIPRWVTKASVGLSQIVFLNNFKRNTVCKASSQSCCHMLQLLEMAPQK